MKVDKKELREKLNQQKLITNIEKIVDDQLNIEPNMLQLKPRTHSFDIAVVDGFLKKNERLILPKTSIPFKRDN